MIDNLEIKSEEYKKRYIARFAEQCGCEEMAKEDYDGHLESYSNEPSSNPEMDADESLSYYVD